MQKFDNENSMDLRSLEIFVEVVNQGGFNRAAAKLNIAQSALSRRLALLEHEIGTQLLERTKRGVRPTAAGARLFARSESLLRHFEQVQDEMLAEAKEPRGEVALGLPPSLQPQMSRALALLRSRFPGLSIRTWGATSVELRGMLLSGKVDLIVYASIEAEQLLTVLPLKTDPLCLIGPTDLSIGDLDKVLGLSPLILTSRPNRVRQLVDTWSTRKGIDLNVALEVNDVSLTLRLVEEGVGLTILPKSALAIRDTRFTSAPIPELAVSWSIAYSKEKPLSVANKCAIEVIRDVFRDS